MLYKFINSASDPALSAPRIASLSILAVFMFLRGLPLINIAFIVSLFLGLDCKDTNVLTNNVHFAFIKFSMLGDLSIILIICDLDVKIVKIYKQFVKLSVCKIVVTLH